MSDGGVLRRKRAGQERHQAPEALPQLLHVLHQAIDVGIQLAPAALHLPQDVIHQALHLCAGFGGDKVRMWRSYTSIRLRMFVFFGWGWEGGVVGGVTVAVKTIQVSINFGLMVKFVV